MGEKGRSVYKGSNSGGRLNMTIHFGCQTYTWQMSYEKYKNKLTHILDVIKQANFQGVEAEVCMLGSFYDDPALLSEELQKRNLQLAALTLALPWQNSQETVEEKLETERLLHYLHHFPEALLILVQLPGQDRLNLFERQKNGLKCVNDVARRAHELGIVSAFHPNSPTGSVFRSAEDYDVMFEGLDTRYVGYCPDSGHIANGEMDVLELFKKSRSMIKHVHFKDISQEKEWRTMGEGVIDHKSIVNYLIPSDYNGWIMVEEESKWSESEPDAATKKNGEYIQRSLR